MIHDFEKTSLVLEEIDTALAELQKSFEHKKESVTNLRKKAEQSVKQIDNLVNKLDEVLK